MQLESYQAAFSLNGKNQTKIVMGKNEHHLTIFPLTIFCLTIFLKLKNNN